MNYTSKVGMIRNTSVLGTQRQVCTVLQRTDDLEWLLCTIIKTFYRLLKDNSL